MTLHNRAICTCSTIQRWYMQQNQGQESTTCTAVQTARASVAAHHGYLVDIIKAVLNVFHHSCEKRYRILLRDSKLHSS